MRTGTKSFFLGLFVCLILLTAFSPSWVTFRAYVLVPEEFSSCLEILRGACVSQQIANPGVEITPQDHKIIRWRLLIPSIAYYLHLPSGLVLALAHVGCIAVLAYVIYSVRRRAALGGIALEEVSLPWADQMLLATVIGGTGWFFVSMGWLGYYDSLLALGLLATASSPSRRTVIAACLLTPWIDERFVIGFPLAMAVRWLAQGSGYHGVRTWLRINLMVPGLLLALYVIIRLRLGGQDGSYSIGSYLSHYGLFQRMTLLNTVWGLWEGLRLAWVLIVMAIWLLWKQCRKRDALVLLLGVMATTVVGIISAQDISRSLVVLLPVVPLGWLYASRENFWKRLKLPVVLAAATLLLPAHIVVRSFVEPVNPLWRELPLLENPPYYFDPNNYLQKAIDDFEKGNCISSFECATVATRLGPDNPVVLHRAERLLQELDQYHCRQSSIFRNSNP